MKQVKLRGEAATHEDHARRIADALRDALPPEYGFTLFVFDQAKDSTAEGPSHMTYISTASRESMVDVIRQWLARVSP